MSMLALTKGSSFQMHGQIGFIEEVKSNYVVFNFEQSGLKMLEPHQLDDAYTKGQFKILEVPKVHVLKSITDPLVAQKYDFITCIMHLLLESTTPYSKSVIEEAILATTQKYGLLEGSLPSVSTVKRWYKKWINNDRSVSFIIKKSKERRRSKFTRECEELADKVIREYYLKFNGSSVSETHNIFLEEFDNCKLEWERQNTIACLRTGDKPVEFKPISRSAFYEIVKKYDAYEVDKARMGLKNARKKHRCVKGSMITLRALQLIEVDAVHPNICIKTKLDDGSFLFEKPVVHVALDVHTRLVVGYVVNYSDGSKQGETANDVAQLLKQVCNPFKKSKHLERAFPLGGKPEYIVSDSGPAYIATLIKAMLRENSIVHHVTAKSSPWKKSFIERFLGTLQTQCLTKIPGSVGARLQGGELDESLEQMAQLSREEFETALEHYIFDIYHFNPHQGLDEWSPIDFWEDIKDRCAPQILCDFDTMNKFHGVLKTPTISLPTGLRIQKRQYNCEELQKLGHTLARRLNNKTGARKVTVMVNPLDISEVTVIDPLNDTYIVVPCISKHVVSGMTQAEFTRLKESRKPKNQRARRTMKQIANVRKEKASSRNDNQKEAYDVIKMLSESELNNMLSKGSNGKQADMLNTKTGVNGTRPSKPSTSGSIDLKPSARR